ncbi:MAG: AraC family transcriptional regulator [Labilithrix sp.]|nr:AraC family transcriptional regulator [Labilithrix sp.]
MARLSNKLDRPRGIVRGPGRALQGPLELVRFEPPADLAPFVEHLWIVRWRLGEETTQTETLGHPSLHWTVEGQESEIVGIVRGRFLRRLEGSGRVVAVKFRPGGFASFYDEPLATLTDRRLPAARVFGPRARRVARTICDAPDDEAAEALCDVLRGHSPRIDPSAQQAERIVEGIAADATLTSVDAVCARFRVAPLALQRLFRAKIGATPKWVIQRYRMHEAVERIAASASRGPPVSFASLAAELGFTDQAHFCRVFKRFIGESPGAYLRKLTRVS